MFVGSITLLSYLVLATAAPCPSNPTDIHVVEKIERPSIDLSKSDKELTDIKYGSPMATDRSDHRVIGLMVARIVATTHVRITSIPIGSGQFCAWPSMVTVTLSTAPTVYVSAAHGKCNLDTTLAHEMRHVAIDSSIIDRYMPVFRNEIESAVTELGTIGPVSRPYLPAIQQEIHDRIHAATSRTFTVLNAERSVEQQKLDSVAEYDRLSRVCARRPWRRNS